MSAFGLSPTDCPQGQSPYPSPSGMICLTPEQQAQAAQARSAAYAQTPEGIAAAKKARLALAMQFGGVGAGGLVGALVGGWRGALGGAAAVYGGEILLSRELGSFLGLPIALVGGGLLFWGIKAKKKP